MNMKRKSPRLPVNWCGVCERHRNVGEIVGKVNVGGREGIEYNVESVDNKQKMRTSSQQMPPKFPPGFWPSL